MSLSDYLKYQRALKGGLTPWEIAEATGVPSREVHLIEVKHRRMGEDDAVLEKLAAFFGVSLGELTARREAYRKRLMFFIEEAISQEKAVALKLEGGETLEGVPVWISREAVALRSHSSPSPTAESNGVGNDDSQEHEGELCVVQRAWIADWRAPEDAGWAIGAHTQL